MISHEIATAFKVLFFRSESADNLDSSSASGERGGIAGLLRLPGFLVSMLGLMVTASAWDWYQSSVAEYLQHMYSLSSSHVGK